MRSRKLGRRPPAAGNRQRLTHLDAKGRIRMVDVGGKAETVKDGITAAARAIDTGAALTVLEKLVSVSHGGQA